MPYRQFFKDGQPTNRVDASSGGFSIADEDAIAEMTELLGGTITVQRTDTPPDISKAQVALPVEEPEVSRRERLLVRLEAAIEANPSTFTEFKAALRGGG